MSKDKVPPFMEDPRGEFTRKVDSELLMRFANDDEKNKVRVELEKQEAQRRRLDSEKKTLETVAAQMARIKEVLTGRDEFVARRFDNIERTEPSDGVGVTYSFSATGAARAARMQFYCQDNATHQAFFVESLMEIEGKMPPRKDYITFPVADVNIARVKKFVEGKILAFIKEYLE